MAKAVTHRWQVRQAANRLLNGEVLAYPTEAVWGLGCDPENESATMRLLAIKNRPVHKGLILVAGSVDQVDFLLETLTPAQRTKILATWPGPTTWLIPDYDEMIPWWIKGDHASVAVRVSAHPLVASLCLAFGGPIVSTSANKAGQRPARTALNVIKHMGQEIDGMLCGSLGSEQKPSRIVDLLSDTVLR
ncbi:MAG: Sua5/YciO/YrdC/YwlC family protein [Pseudohongiellaceae bacterium]